MAIYTVPTTMTVWQNWAGTTVNSVTATAMGVWPIWVNQTTVANTTMYVNPHQVWQEVWQEWAAGNWGTVVVAMDEPIRTEPERQANQQEWEAMVATAEEAKCRAKELLVRLLDDEQAAQYEEQGSFELRTDKRRYRIQPGHRVAELDETGKTVALMCIHPDGRDGMVPVEDTAIAQKLMLETDEDGFHRIANRQNVNVA